MSRARSLSIVRAGVVLVVCACSGDATPPTPAAGSASVVAPAPRELSLAAVPADTAFVFATVDPLRDVPWSKLRAAIDVAALAATAESRRSTAVDAVERVELATWSELAAALRASDPAHELGIAWPPRFVVYGLGLVPVVRIELADLAVTRRALDRIAKRAGVRDLRVDANGTSFIAALDGNQLAIAIGSSTAMHAIDLAKPAKTPLDAQALRAFASSHGLLASGVGWIDVARIATLDPLATALDALPKACRTEMRELLNGIPKFAVGLAELTPEHVSFAATGALDPATEAAIDKAPGYGLPTALPAHPWVAFSMFMPVVPAWTAEEQRFAERCKGTELAGNPAPLSSLRGAALVVYGGTWTGLLPESVDGFVGIADDDPVGLLALIARWWTELRGRAPSDGAPPIRIALGDSGLAVGVARRAHALFAVMGDTAAQHFTEFGPRASSPLFRLFIDVARFPTPSAASEPTFESAAGLDRIFGRVVTTLDVSIVAHDGELQTRATAVWVDRVAALPTQRH